MWCIPQDITRVSGRLDTSPPHPSADILSMMALNPCFIIHGEEVTVPHQTHCADQLLATYVDLMSSPPGRGLGCCVPSSNDRAESFFRVVFV